ncbi:hypothetical protein ACJW31_09G153000 [Castanea mollissima]
MYRSILLSHRLPDDLVYDILTRLPVKSLIRFRCVSRSWYCTITDSDFITKHLDRANLLSNSNNGANYAVESSHILYLWNLSIRKFKRLLATPLIRPFDSAAFGFGYHSQNNDYKILRFVFFRSNGRLNVPPAEAEIYTLSTDSWRRVAISVESFSCSGTQYFILSFDVNDERFRKILLPPNYLNGVSMYTQYLAVFKGPLALMVFGVAENSKICHIWVMKEYGVVESWTKRCVPMGELGHFYGCTINGELLIEKYGDHQTLAFDPESLNEEIHRIPRPEWMIYTANFVESLVLLDGLNISSQSEN